MSDESDPSWKTWPGVQGGDSTRVEIFVEEISLTSGISFEPDPVGVTVIVGANNAGKSTLLRQINTGLNSGGTQLQHEHPRLVQGLRMRRNLLFNDFAEWLAKNAKYSEVERGQEAYFARDGMHIGRGHLLGICSSGAEHIGDVYSLFVFFADASNRLQMSVSSGARSITAEAPTHPLHRFQDSRNLFDDLRIISKRVFGLDLLLDDFSGAHVLVRVGSVDLPIPPRDRPLGQFGEAVAKLPTLDGQGDGMRSFFGLLVPLVAGSHKIVLVDEPEAFLHPPQARAFGKILADIAEEKSIQVIAATHDKDFIAGLLSSNAPVSVVRLIRDGDTTKVATLSSTRLKEVWDDRNLRYTNILNGLFSRLVVVCESEQDCRFFEAAFDRYADKYAQEEGILTIPVSDILFVPSGGKGGFYALHSVLANLAVPMATIADIDVLADDAVLRPIVERSGESWPEIERNLRIVRSSLGDGKWSAPKKSGERAFSGEQLAAFIRVLEQLDTAGLMVLRVGELEGFAPIFSKDRAWLRNALGQGADSGADAEALVARVMQSYARRLGSGIDGLSQSA